MTKIFKPNRTLATQYKKTGGGSKFIGFSLAVYDEFKLIYDNNGSITLATIEQLITFINEKYGTSFKVIEKEIKNKEV